MPRIERITCVGCDKRIDGSSLNGFSNKLFRLFLSARSLKRICSSDLACRKCRWKFDNWMKKTKDDFLDLTKLNDFEVVTVTFYAF